MGGGTLGAGASISPLVLPDPRKTDAHMRPQNLNDPESDQAPLCGRVKLGEERCVTTQRTPAYKITEITGNTAMEKKKMNKHENSNILQNDFEKLVKTLILLHFQVLLILFMLSFLLSSLLRDEVKIKVTL